MDYCPSSLHTYIRALFGNPDGADRLYERTKQSGDSLTAELMALTKRLKDIAYRRNDDGGTSMVPARLSPNPSPLVVSVRLSCPV